MRVSIKNAAGATSVERLTEMQLKASLVINKPVEPVDVEETAYEIPDCGKRDLVRLKKAGFVVEVLETK